MSVIGSHGILRWWIKNEALHCPHKHNVHLWPKKEKEASPSFSSFFSLSHLPASNGHPSLLAASSVSSDKPPWLHPPLSGFVERRQSSPGSPPALCVHSRQNLTGRGSAARPDDLTRRQEAAGGGSAHRPTNGS